MNSAVCKAVVKISPRNISESTLCVLSRFSHVTNHKNRHVMKIILGGIVQFSRSVLSDSLQLHELQHVRPPCASPTPEFTQIHVHWVGDAIQPSHPLSSPSPPAFNLSQHQGLFKWVSSLHQVAKVLKFQLQHQSLQWIFRTDFLQFKGLSRVFSNTY